MKPQTQIKGLKRLIFNHVSNHILSGASLKCIEKKGGPVASYTAKITTFSWSKTQD